MSSMTFVPQQSITKRKTFQLEIEKNEVLGNYAIKSAKKNSHRKKKQCYLEA